MILKLAQNQISQASKPRKFVAEISNMCTFFLLFLTSLHVPKACEQQSGGVPHPEKRPTRHQNLSLFVLVCYLVPAAVVPDLGVFRFNPPKYPFLPTAHLCPPLPPFTLPLPGQLPPVTTTASPTGPPYSSPPPHIGPELVASQYTARPYSAFTKCKITLAQTPRPLSPTPLRYTPTFHSDYAVEAALSVAATPGLGNPP